MMRGLANGLGGFGGQILLAQIDTERRCSRGEGCLKTRDISQERSVIGSWLDVAGWARVAIRGRIRSEMLDLLQQRLERIRIRHLLHHLIEQMLDVCVNALRREDRLDDLLCRLLAVSKSACASRSVLAMTRSALIQRHPSRGGLVC